MLQAAAESVSLDLCLAERLVCTFRSFPFAQITSHFNRLLVGAGFLQHNRHKPPVLTASPILGAI